MRDVGRPPSTSRTLLAGAAAGARRSPPSSTPTTRPFLPPGDMPARIAAACRRTGQPVPPTPAETVRCILDSLALAYRRAVARRRSGSPAGDVDVVHIVGGGARNELLCQLTADACGLPVRGRPGRGRRARQRPGAGPRARARRPRPAAMRALIHPSRTYEPRPGGDWTAAEGRLPG